MKQSTLAVVAILAVLLLAALTLAGVMARRAQTENDTIAGLRTQIAGLTAQVNAAAAEKVAPSVKLTVIDEKEYDGWPTYTNTATGFTLRYPAAWTVAETDSTLDGHPLRYVTFLSPQNEYYVNFGLRRKGEDVLLSQRTGVGAGTFKKAGTIPVLASPVTRVDLTYKGKVKGIFFPAAGSVFATHGFEGYAEFGKSAPTTYESFDLSQVPQTALALKIIKSVTLK
jgi:hypothetical protein